MTTRYLADTLLTCDREVGVVRDAAIDVDDDGRVEWVGPAASAPVGAATVHDLGGLVMPGLVNTHCHTPMTLVRGAGDGLPLQRWLTEVMWPREGQMTPDDVWWGMTLGSAEMLRAGVTTSCEMYLFEEAVIDSVQHSGARLVMTPGVLSVLHADSFGASDSRADAIARIHARFHDPDGRITIGVAPHSAYDLGVERCAELAALARDLDALLHIHVAESRDEGRELEERHGGSTVQVLADAGVFGGRVLAAHSVWVDADDIATYARHGVAVAHCPQSNMKLGSGIAPVAELLAAGITVALGTDGPASNDDLDLWEELRLAPMLARAATLDAAAVSTATALDLATANGADALGLDVGRLRPGAWADFQRLDVDDAAFVPVTSADELLAHVVWSGSSRHVTDVWVAGAQVVRARECLTVDEARARHEVQTRAERLVRDAG